jgi:hypothetical protein
MTNIKQTEGVESASGHQPLNTLPTPETAPTNRFLLDMIAGFISAFIAMR